MLGSSFSFPRPRTFERIRVSSSKSFATRITAKWHLLLAFVNRGTISDAEISSCSVDTLTSAPTYAKQKQVDVLPSKNQAMYKLNDC